MQVAGGLKKDHPPQEVEIVSQSKVIHFAQDSCSKILMVTKLVFLLRQYYCILAVTTIRDITSKDFNCPFGRPVSMGSTGAPLLILRPPRGYHPHTGKVKVGVCVLVVLLAWNGEVWTASVIEVSDHTCWPSMVWEVHMTNRKMFADLATNCTIRTNSTNH